MSLLFCQRIIWKYFFNLLAIKTESWNLKKSFFICRLKDEFAFLSAHYFKTLLRFTRYEDRCQKAQKNFSNLSFKNWISFLAVFFLKGWFFFFFACRQRFCIDAVVELLLAIAVDALLSAVFYPSFNSCKTNQCPSKRMRLIAD